jgi:hypothetical protein
MNGITKGKGTNCFSRPLALRSRNAAKPLHIASGLGGLLKYYGRAA